MAIDLPAVRFLAAYPALVRSVSTSRTGNRAISFVEYADPFWQIDMATTPLSASERLLVETFRDQAEGGRVTVTYTPKHQCIPKAYWGDADNAALTNTGVITGFTNRRTFTFNSVDNGLTLLPGDLIGLEQDGYRTLARIATGGVASGNALTVTVEPLVPGYIGIGATVVFRQPKLNTRVLPGSFSMANDNRPSASFTLVEVPK